MEKFDGFTTENLIRQTQNFAVLLKTSKKKMGTKRFIQGMSNLRDMQNEVIKRLATLDRRDPKFFPIGSLIEYTKSDVFKVYKAEGVVTGYGEDGRSLIVKLNGTQDEIYVNPKNLKLLHIRHFYI